MPSPFKSQRRVEFAETDMAGIMHFSNFFRHMEMAEHAFLRSVGQSVWMTVDGTEVGWPRVSATCDYKSPLRFEEEFEIHLSIREIRRKAVIWDHRFVRSENGVEVEVARGSMTTVCVTKDPATGNLRSTEIPQTIVELLSPYLSTEGATS